MRILIVDDNRAHAESLEMFLRLSMSLETELAFSGRAAIEQARFRRPDVMLVDQKMPGLSGVEVATRVREIFVENPPYLIAMTGYPLESSRLMGIDAVFDRAFAKPLDLEELVATLERLASGATAVGHTPHPVDLAEVLTRVARQILPIAVGRGVLVSFDCQGPRIVIDEDPIDIHCAFHRLLMELMDIVETSYVLFTVEVTFVAADQFHVTVNAAASGELKPDGVIDAALARLGLKVDDAVSTPQRRFRQAAGRCINTGADLVCSIDSQEGVLIRAQRDYAGTVAEDAVFDVGKSAGTAWFVDSHPVAPTWGERRLQGLGWQVERFSACSTALNALESSSATSFGAEPCRAPELLIVMEAPGQSDAELAMLRERLPDTSICILAVMAGSAALGDPARNRGYEVRTLPFSPLDLAELSDASRHSRAVESVSSGPADFDMVQRPTVLLVDDNAVNRFVGQATLESLGYKVRVAHDGLDAIDQCKRQPPALVLMDLDMPVLRGLEATQRLRELQRMGALPPFAVIAATSDGSPEARLACAKVGMNAFLTKPFTLAELRTELLRFIDPAFRRAH